jgi:hypothetical protein
MSFFLDAEGGDTPWPVLLLINSAEAERMLLLL